MRLLEQHKFLGMFSNLLQLFWHLENHLYLALLSLMKIHWSLAVWLMEVNNYTLHLAQRKLIVICTTTTLMLDFQFFNPKLKISDLQCFTKCIFLDTYHTLDPLDNLLH